MTAARQIESDVRPYGTLYTYFGVADMTLVGHL